ncbi:MAG: NADH-quinone oxidoreductase subunit L [Bacteroidia bacterium]|nr:NADH-quinone oxidoreductase subunit L [Bacteroidia bacterium]
MIKLIGLVPILPLIGFLITGLFGRKLSKGITSIIACGSVLASFLISLAVFFEIKSSGEHAVTVNLFEWISSGKLHVSFSFLVDPLSSLFLLIITGVGFLIHVYSVGYMHNDEGFSRFFAYLNLFVFFMLLLVLGSNYLLMYVGWEGVGLCSYLLIGFWYKNTSYNNAAKKAFIMNRVGDLVFVLGIILIFVTFGSINYTEVFGLAKFHGTEPVITAITLLLFVGAVGKSAQLPLYTWLPDAMAGPTPVSALIHAATMVTAGIYMIARSNILYTLSPFTMSIVALVGVITSLFAAAIGLFQNDIKKVLAYSTVSQLGLMFLALGVGAYVTGVFHVMTHAFFKALLFLGAGSVIHAMSGEQDIRNMGGLKKYLPVTYWTFLLAALAISGVFPFAGFFSKDEILAKAFEHNKLLWFLGSIASAMTAFYMFRLLYLTFFGSFRGTKEQEHHVHESPKSMTIPLMVLAVLSVTGGFVGLPAVSGMPHLLEGFLEPVFADSDMKMFPSHISHETEITLMLTALSIAVIMIFLAYNFYIKQKKIPVAEGVEINPAQKVVYNKFYLDEFYNALVTKPLNRLSDIFYRFMELRFIDAIVNAIGELVKQSSKIVRLIQTGSIEFYLLMMVLSIALILFVK